MAVAKLGWAVEVDLHPDHATSEGIANDNLRDDGADALGWDTHRVGRLEYERSFDAAIDRLVGSYERRRREVDALRAAGVWPPR